jgi:hypothetical protein
MKFTLALLSLETMCHLYKENLRRLKVLSLHLVKPERFFAMGKLTTTEFVRPGQITLKSSMQFAPFKFGLLSMNAWLPS